MTKMRREFAPEFKREAVALLESSGRPFDAGCHGGGRPAVRMLAPDEASGHPQRRCPFASGRGRGTATSRPRPDTTVIFLWLGRGNSTRSTQPFLHAHLAVKEAALAKVAPMWVQGLNRFRADDQLLAFLDGL